MINVLKYIKMPRYVLYMIVGFIILNVIDMCTTGNILLNYDGAYEANPFMHYLINIGFAYFISIKIIVMILISSIYLYINDKYGDHRTIIDTGLFLLNVMYLLIALNNTSFWWLYGR